MGPEMAVSTRFNAVFFQKYSSIFQIVKEVRRNPLKKRKLGEWCNNRDCSVRKNIEGNFRDSESPPNHKIFLFQVFP